MRIRKDEAYSDFDNLAWFAGASWPLAAYHDGKVKFANRDICTVSAMRVLMGKAHLPMIAWLTELVRPAPVPYLLPPPPPALASGVAHAAIGATVDSCPSIPPVLWSRATGVGHAASFAAPVSFRHGWLGSPFRLLYDDPLDPSVARGVGHEVQTLSLVRSANARTRRRNRIVPGQAKQRRSTRGHRGSQPALQR